MTREEYNQLRDALLNGTADAYDIFEAVIDLFYNNQDLQHELAEAKGRIYELEETLDGRG